MVSDGFVWYGFVEGDALRFRFLFASEPVEDFLSAFLSAFFPFEFKYSTFYSAEHGSYPCRLVFTHFAFLDDCSTLFLAQWLGWGGYWVAGLWCGGAERWSFDGRVFTPSIGGVGQAAGGL